MPFLQEQKWNFACRHRPRELGTEEHPVSEGFVVNLWLWVLWGSKG